MRGQVDGSSAVWVVFDAEARVPADHPLRAIRAWCDARLREMSRDFDRAYGTTGRPGVPPEQLLKALLLQALYSIPSEIKLMEAVEHNLLYRWFLGLPLDRPAWTPEVFSMNRDRFASFDLVRKFFDRVVAEAIEGGLVSPDHFSIDGSLIRSLASHKSLTPIDGEEPPDQGHGGEKGRDADVDWKGQKRSNATHRSTTDPEARLARKGPGRESHLCHSAHVVMENRSGLCLAVAVDRADGHAERRSALRLLRRIRRRHGLVPGTAGLDAGYKAGEFLAALEAHGTTPHVPVAEALIRGGSPGAHARRRARRRMGTVGYRLSQRVRKRAEQVFGWCKTVGRLARTRFIGQDRIEAEAMITAAAYNLLRIANLGRA
ncbi:MAG: IS5 family transposase [Phycisphaerales bacterium]